MYEKITETFTPKQNTSKISVIHTNIWNNKKIYSRVLFKNDILFKILVNLKHPSKFLSKSAHQATLTHYVQWNFSETKPNTDWPNWQAYN